jgi:hypothetical protein
MTSEPDATPQQNHGGGVDVSTYRIETPKPSTDGPGGAGVITPGEGDSTFSDNRTILFSLTSLFLSLTQPPEMYRPLMHDPINPRCLQIYRVLTPSPEEGEILPTKPILRTEAAINGTILTIGAMADATSASSKLPTRRSLLGDSSRLSTPNNHT